LLDSESVVSTKDAGASRLLDEYPLHPPAAVRHALLTAQTAAPGAPVVAEELGHAVVNADAHRIGIARPNGVIPKGPPDLDGLR